MRKRMVAGMMVLGIVLHGICGNELKGTADNEPSKYSERELKAISRAGLDPNEIYISDMSVPTSSFELAKWKESVSELAKGKDFEYDNYKHLPNLYYRWNCYFTMQSGDQVFIQVEKGGESLLLKINQDWEHLLQLKRDVPIYIEFHGTDGNWEITYMERIDGIASKHCATCSCF